MTREVPLLDRLMHDLKGPLAPLQTAAYLLGREDLPPERRRELLDTLERQSRRLGHMIDEAGDWFRASQHRLVSRSEPCALTVLIDNAICSIPGCHVEPVIPAELAGLDIRGDESRLLQMLVTLLRHACARDPGGTPGLVVDSSAQRLRITVSDQGPNLDSSGLADLLDQPCPEPLDAGLGLRMLIAHAIAIGHGGTLVAVPNLPHRGLSLVCELPLA
jgi:signal transduction histidine kinase